MRSFLVLTLLACNGCVFSDALLPGAQAENQRTVLGMSPICLFLCYNALTGATTKANSAGGGALTTTTNQTVSQTGNNTKGK